MLNEREPRDTGGLSVGEKAAEENGEGRGNQIKGFAKGPGQT